MQTATSSAGGQGRYLVGIDLGTTNSALAFVDLQRLPRGQVPGRRDIQTFSVPQLVGPGQAAERPLLPSFLYLPGPHDLPAGAAAMPWDPAARDIVGDFARTQGGRVPGRLVSSAKSWLSHAGVDRTTALLPWGAPPEVPRVSPLEASARYLEHLVKAWDNAPGRAPEDALGKQSVVLTVPASFDDVARNLTVEAAKRAGLTRVTLLEEPQAAFYCWLALHPAEEAGRLKPGMRCVVIDVGGGTSDFSLIRAGEEQGEMAFVREAVGEHLLLGGDNMDLALAKHAEGKLAQAGRLDAAQFGQLVQACRSAKEQLLAADGPDSVKITIAGRGRAVIGGSLSATLTAAECRQVLFDGFFPAVGRAEQPQRPARAGLHEMGLPYVADPAITRHLAAFLAKHLDGQTGPDAILFNGGVFQPPVLQERLVDVMRPWYQLPTGPWQPTVLDNPSLDLAVAWGAAYANWLRYSGGRRIGGGIARSYYVGVAAGTGEAASPETPADGDGQATILCLVPRRLAEGEEVVLDRPRMELALGEPVVFPLYTSTVRADDRPGDVLRVSPEQLLQLPPLTTVLRGGKRSAGVVKTVPVTLAAKCTEIGTLELACVSTDGNNRWRLEFNVREMVATVGTDAEERAPVADVLPEEQVQAAAGLIRSCYRGGDPAAAELTKAIEAALESPRGEWPMLLCRRMWEPLAEVSEDRRRSPAHLSRWYNLAGFCLRPGYGDPLDRFRMDQFWKLFNAPPKAPALTSAGSGQVTRTAAPPPAGGADHWIMWRRVAGGLNPAHQQALFERLRPVLVPGKSKPPARPGANELAEMWRCASSLERLDVRLKEQLGAALLATVRPGSTPPYAFWSLTRLGARVLLYGPLNAVVHPSVVAPWVEQLLAYTPADDNERAGWGFCLANLARRSGQRALDLDEELTARVAEALRGAGVSAEWVRMVEEVVEMEGDARSRLFGEALPIGLRLTGG